MLPFGTPPQSSVPPGPAFEADLRAVRDARGLSLDEIQRETRIPVDVLRRFEEGDLVGDPSYNPVYLKAFLTSYAKAVGLPVADVLAAYESHNVGRYAGELHPDHKPGTPPRAAPEPPPDPVPAPETPAPTKPVAPPALEALASARSPESRPPAAPATPLSQTRVSRPAVPSARRSFDKNWGSILGLFAVLAVVLGVVLWLLVFRDSDRPEADGEAAVAVGDEGAADIDSTGVGAGAATGGPQLQLPLTVTVTAGGDGLQSFRVTTDAGERRPYWIDTGSSETFTADSALVLWGEGDDLAFADATVEFQGQRFSPPNGSAFAITSENGQRVLDSLATSTPALPDASGPPAP